MDAEQTSEEYGRLTPGELLERSHDPQAMRFFITVYLAPVQRLLGALCRNAPPDIDPQDLAQEVFMRAFETRMNGDGHQITLPWLLRVARNLFLDKCKRSRPVNDCVALGNAPDRGSETGLLTAAEREEVLRIYGMLAPEDRDILERKFTKSETHQEIADAYGITVPAARKRLARAIARSRDFMEAHGYAGVVDELGQAD